MRFALATAFAVIVVPANAVSQAKSVDASSLQVGARARILESPKNSRYIFINIGSETPDRLRFILGGLGGAAIGYGWRTESWVPANLPQRP